MNHEPSRYIAQVEIPDGFATIDCEIEGPASKAGHVRITLILASCSYKTVKTKPGQENLTLREELDLFQEAIRLTDRKDFKTLIDELLREAYGEKAEITISRVDMD